MIIKKSKIQYNSSRGVFGQKTYFEDENQKIFLTLIICSSEEFMAKELRSTLEYIMNTNVNNLDIKNWFDERINNIAVLEKDSQNKKMGNLIIDAYPKNSIMIDAAKSFI